MLQLTGSLVGISFIWCVKSHRTVNACVLSLTMGSYLYFIFRSNSGQIYWLWLYKS